jgi:hypothetical protein
MRKALRRITVVLILLASASGCASIISGRTAQVKIDSHPRNAHVSVRDHEGSQVAQATTPATVELKRGRTWLRPARYTATIYKPGYQTAQAPIRSTLNPWVFGNVAAGGVIGLAVDGTTGAGWKPKPNEIVLHLQPMGEYDVPMEEGPRLTSAEAPADSTTKPKKRPRVASKGYQRSTH